MKSPQSVAIVGAGPAACTLAALLAQRGVNTVVYGDGKRPEMLVGESLIPAVVPLLRRLDIEERTAAISQRKPGVSFLHGGAASIHFNFAPIAPLPTYAYNVDRMKFDELLKARAMELGAVFQGCRAGVVKAPPGTGRELVLDEASLAAAPSLNNQQPDLLVDATGRTRLFARLLQIGAQRGKRDDVASFAHYEGFAMPEPAGQVLITRLDQGWSWRIPLPGKLSVGMVTNKKRNRELGATAEERLEKALQSEPLMAEAARHARRVSPVATYTNYQLVSDRCAGPGWAAVGDAFGFVDPMLSSGLFLAMESAAQLDAALEKGTRLGGYDLVMRRWYAAWNELIGYFYDGRIFSLYEAGHQMRQRRSNPVQLAIDRTLNKHIARLTSGASTRSHRSRWLLKAASRLLIHGVKAPRELAIRYGGLAPKRWPVGRPQW